MLKFISDLFKVDENVALYIFIGVVLVLVIAILLIIIAMSKKDKKKVQAKKASNVTTKEEIKTETSVSHEDEEIKETPVKEKIEEEDEMKKEVKVQEEKKVEVKAQEVQPKKVVTGKYEVFPVSNFFLYRLKASNGEIMVVSEIYKTLKGAKDAVETVKKNIENGVLTVSEDKHGLWQFKLYSSNKRLLAVSANYPTKDRCQSASESFKRFAFVSPIIELEEDPEHLMELFVPQKEEDKKGGKIVVDEFDSSKENEFKVVASNGSILATSMSYRTSESLLSQIDGLKETAQTGTFFVSKDKNGKFQFKLYSTTGRCAIYGEAYDTKQRAISAANSFVSFVELSEKVLPDNLK